MGTPHKHRDAIISWANGEEIQREHKGGWIDIKDPLWDRSINYRVKPKRVKKEGWVNIYSETQRERLDACGFLGWIWVSKEEADSNCIDGSVDCIRIEWEEEI